jgi:hypothetical protein
MVSKEQEKAARGVDSVTDYVEEKEIGDAEKAKQSLNSLSAETANQRFGFSYF